MKAPHPLALFVAPFTLSILLLGAVLLVGGQAAARRSSAERALPERGPENALLYSSGEERPEGSSSDLEFEVKDVFPVPELSSHAVMLVAKNGASVLPIFVNEEAAISIAFRLADRKTPHAMSADLLDDVLAKLGGSVQEVHIDKVSENVFQGRVLVKRGAEMFELSAAPSDSLALAVKGHARILVAQPVIEEAGLSHDELGDLKRKMGEGGMKGFGHDDHDHEGPGVGGSGRAGEEAPALRPDISL